MMDPAPPKPYKPISILELISEDTLRFLVKGFREHLDSGVSFHYTDLYGNLRFYDPTEEEPDSSRKRQYWSRLCVAFRETSEGQAACHQFDDDKTHVILSDPTTQAYAYECQPLHLIDMVAPVVIRGTSLGMIFAGQRLPRQPAEGQKVLDYIRAKYHDRFSELESAFEEEYDPANLHSNLASPSEVKETLNKLKGFANVIREIAQSAEQAKVRIAQKDFMQYWARRLSEVRLDTNISWRRPLLECLESLLGFIELPAAQIGIFYGEKSGSKIIFHPVAMNLSKFWKARSFAFSESEFNRVGSLQPNPASPLPRPVSADVPGKGWLYFHPCYGRAGRNVHDLRSLIVLQTAEVLPQEKVGFIQEFSEGLGQWDAITRLLITQRKTHAQFEKNVTNVGHDLRTSIQHVVDFVDELLDTLTESPEAMRAPVETCRQNIRLSIDDHTGYIGQLKAPATPRRPSYQYLEILDLFAILREQIKLFEIVAKRKGLRSVEIDLPSTTARVVCPRVQLRRAFAALLDNAIKYSYISNKVWIQIDGEAAFGRAEIRIENYGIGIPSHVLRELNGGVKGVRGEVPDIYYRPGYGLGVSIARSVFEGILGGRLQFESQRAHSAAPEEPYHRYITVATITVPVKE